MDIINFFAKNELLNSAFLNSLITFAAGLIAYAIYKKRKSDDKKDAATILLTEIGNASTLLTGLRERFKANRNAALNEDLSLLPSESWSRFKYLFVNELSDQEWQGIDKFYKNCLSYDLSVKENKSYFINDTQQIWVNIQKYYADEIKKFMLKNPDIQVDSRGMVATPDDELRKKIQSHTDTYIANTTLAAYSPSKPLNDAERALNNINEEILITSAGIALEKIAKPSSVLSRLFLKK